MLLILCEDSNMGKEFWKAVNRFCIGGMAKVVSANGVDKMLFKLKSISLTDKDEVIFAIDNIGNVKVRSILRGAAG